MKFSNKHLAKTRHAIKKMLVIRPGICDVTMQDVAGYLKIRGRSSCGLATLIAGLWAVSCPALSSGEAAVACDHRGGEDRSPVNADVAWAEVRAGLDWFADYKEAAKKWPEGSLEFARWYESAKIRLRERGLKFWTQFPGDARKFDWLSDTVSFAPHYWKNMEIGVQSLVEEPRKGSVARPVELDQIALDEWNTRYVAMRAEFLTAKSAVRSWGLHLRSNEFLQKITAVSERWKSGEGVAPFDLITEMMEYAEAVSDKEGYVLGGIFEYLYTECLDVYVELSDLRSSYLAAMRASTRSELRELAGDLERKKAFIGKPLNLTLTTTTGGVVDLNALKGKVVVVDFWALTCSSCVKDTLPELKRLYDKYHDKGLEIVGVVFEEPKDLPKLEALLHKVDVQWPHSLQGRGRGPGTLWKNFGFTAFGTLFFLDRDGRVVWMNYRHGELESLVRRHLNLPD